MKLESIWDSTHMMGLNPHAIKRVLKAMERSPTREIDPSFLLEVFQEQHN
jgi:hypothetical protein